MELRSLAKSSTLYLIGMLANRLVGFLMIPVYTHFLSTSDYGVLEIVELLVNVSVLTLGMMALGSAMVRIYHDRDDPEWQAGTISTALLLTVGLMGTLTALGALASNWLTIVLFDRSEFGLLLRVSFAAMLFSHPMQMGLSYLRIKDRAAHFVLFSLAHLTVVLALNIWLIAFLHWGIWGFILSKIVGSGLGCLYITRLLIREVGVRWNAEAARRMIRFGSPLVLASLATFGVHFVDRFFLNHYASISDVGIYALAYKFGFLISYLVGAPFAAAFNVRAYAHTREEGWKRSFSEIVGYLVFFSFYCWVGLSILIDPTLAIIAAPAFRAAAVLVPVIAMGYVARTLGDFFRVVLFVSKRSGTSTKVVVLCAAVNLGLNFVLIPSFGAWGAAWATLATWTVFFGCNLTLAQREHHLPLPYVSALVHAFVGVALYLISRLAPGGLGGWAVRVPLAVSYPVFIWVCGGFSAAQKAALGRTGRGILDRLRRAVARPRS